jgi:hypothetical protein
MASRLELQTRLEEILGNNSVYFQPPESVKMVYPAIVYALDDIAKNHSDDGVYLLHKRYSVTVIDKNPDSEFIDSVALLPLCSFNRHYKSNNLNHWNYSLYY